MSKRNNLDSLREAERAGVLGPSIAQDITRWIFGLFCAIALFVVSALTMIHGWGVEPQSWPWIISGYSFSLLAMYGSKLAESGSKS